MVARWPSGRETSLVHDDFRPDAHGRVRETALEAEVRMVFPAIFGVVADPDLDRAGDEIVLEESIARRRVQANLKPAESVLRARRSVVLAPDRLLVRPGAPGGLAVLELERDIGDLKSQIGHGPVKSNDALRGCLARAHDHISRRDVRHELALLDVLSVDDAIVRLRGAAFQLADEPRAVRGAHLDLCVFREECRELLPLARNWIEVHGTRAEDHVPPRIEFKAVRPRALAAHIAQEDPRAAEARPFRAAIPVRVVRRRGLGLLHVLPVPRDVRGAREENVRVRLRQRSLFRRGYLPEFPER